MQTREHKQYNEPLATEKIHGARKTYFIDLKKNNQGLFVKVTEKVGEHRNTIIISSDDLDEFIQAATRIETELRRRI